MKAINKLSVTVEEQLYKYYKTKNGQFPVRIKVTHNRNTKYYPVKDDLGKNIFLTEAEWHSIVNKNIRGTLKTISDHIQLFKSKLTTEISEINNSSNFSFKSLENKTTQFNSDNFYAVFINRLVVLKKENRIGTLIAYQNALSSLQKFHPKKTLLIIDITPEFLIDYDNYLRKVRNNTTATIAMYMRTIRSIYNICKAKDRQLEELYPFSKSHADTYRYKIKEGSARNANVLDEDQIRKFIGLKYSHDSLEFEAQNFWVFSLLCQGMNFIDISLLKGSNFRSNYFSYIRQKTKNSEKRENKITVPLNDLINKIIHNLGGNVLNGDSCVFPILKGELDPTRQKLIVKQKIKRINHYLAKICSDNNLPRITTYWARHSYGGTIKQGGTPDEVCCELLGHSKIETTKLFYQNMYKLDRYEKANENIYKLFDK